MERGDYAAAIVSSQQRVGVDIEEVVLAIAVGVGRRIGEHVPGAGFA